MEKETKMKRMLCQVFVSVLLCIVMIVMKFILKEEKILEEIYNYLITDIVFLNEI